MTEKVQPRKESFTEYVRRLDVERDARKSAREAKQASGARYTWADFLPVESQRPKASDRIIIFELVKTEL